MSEIISLLKDYSPAVAILLAAAGGLLYVLKLIVERAVASSFDARAKMLELSLQRRSAFEEKVLTDRFALVTDLSARLQRLTTDYNRTRLGQPAPEGFYKGNEIVPLTRLFDDLEIHRLVLTEEFYELFVREAQLTLRWVNAHEPLESKTVEEQLLRTKADIRVHAETVFGMSQIRQ